MNLIGNILSEYRAAGSAHLSAGLTWYRDANRLAQQIAETNGATVEAAAGVIAALSPNTPWERNQELAINAFYNGRAYGTFGNSVDKANRIMAGEAPLDVLGGLKVRSFYGNIVNPNDKTIVTIDRHAYDIAVGVRNGKDSRPIGTVKQYDVYRHAYMLASLELDVLPWQVQAVTWESWRSRLTSRRGSNT